MIQKTVERLGPVSAEEDFWVITNEFVAEEVRRQLPRIPARQLVVESEPRNTAPAIGLAAFLLEKFCPEAERWSRTGASQAFQSKPKSDHNTSFSSMQPGKNVHP